MNTSHTGFLHTDSFFVLYAEFPLLFKSLKALCEQLRTGYQEIIAAVISSISGTGQSLIQWLNCSHL